jgi:tRNA wybutosine-synthesizing protein 4
MLPLINRGTWTRVFSVRTVVSRFLAAYAKEERVQILSLGAGFDVTYFWLRDVVPDVSNLKYVEIDFPDVTERKAQIIRKTEALSQRVWDSEAVPDGETINSKHYALVAGDIRETEALGETLNALGVDPKAPTLVLTECVLVYLKPEDSRRILGFIKSFLTGDAAVLNYEMIKPDDNFGRVMLENLEVITS